MTYKYDNVLFHNNILYVFATFGTSTEKVLGKTTTKMACRNKFFFSRIRTRSASNN